MATIKISVYNDSTNKLLGEDIFTDTTITECINLTIKKYGKINFVSTVYEQLLLIQPNFNVRFIFREL